LPERGGIQREGLPNESLGGRQLTPDRAGCNKNNSLLHNFEEPCLLEASALTPRSGNNRNDPRTRRLPHHRTRARVLRSGLCHETVGSSPTSARGRKSSPRTAGAHRFTFIFSLDARLQKSFRIAKESKKILWRPHCSARRHRFNRRGARTSASASNS